MTQRLQVFCKVLPSSASGRPSGSLCWIWDALAKHAVRDLGADLTLLLGGIRGDRLSSDV
jgi:hypothetical protein